MTLLNKIFPIISTSSVKGLSYRIFDKSDLEKSGVVTNEVTKLAMLQHTHK